ncbi:MAG: extracellular solute-binding protein [Chloroflexia bacterium]|nr:extracellular solute-binding protein [Chloroflexia bacterium]
MNFHEIAALNRWRLSRRRTLQLLGGAGAAALAPQGGVAAAQSTPAASPVAGYDIPDSGADLPDGQVTFLWSSFGGEDFPAQRLAEAYQETHPNITVQYDHFPPNDYSELIGIGIQNDNAPDLFRRPNSVSAAEMVQAGWVAPLDEVVPDFEAWKGAFPPNSFFEGINVFGGKTYSFPFLGDKQYGSLTYYNVDVLHRAGYDPLTEPWTWSTFREAARKVTEQGGGDIYGWVIGGEQANRWSILVNSLAAMAGATGAEFNHQTGEYNYATDAYLAAIDLLRAVQSDGSLFPGSLSLSNQEAQDRLPQGVAAMMFVGPQIVPIYVRESPDFNFNVVSQPLPDGIAPLPVPATISGEFWFVYANSPRHAICGDLVSYIGSPAGQTDWQVVSGGQAPMAFPEANEIGGIDQRSLRIFELYEEQMRLAPSPYIRNPAAAQVLLELRPPQPNLGQLVQGIVAGQISDPRQAMQELKDASEQALNAAIEAARAKGAEVTRDDWVFPNWDPAQNYTEADYQEL